MGRKKRIPHLTLGSSVRQSKDKLQAKRPVQKLFKLSRFLHRFYNRIFKVFLKMDGGEDVSDRRLDLDEFVRGCDAMQLGLTRREAEDVFRKLDANGVLFCILGID